MSAPLEVSLRSLEALDLCGLDSVIGAAMDLRAKAWLRRLAELVTTPVIVSAEQQSEYDDAGSTFSFWTADIRVSLVDGRVLSISSDDLQEPDALDEEDFRCLSDVFGASSGRDEGEVLDGIEEFSELSRAYAAYASDGESEVEFTVVPREGEGG